MRNFRDGKKIINEKEVINYIRSIDANSQEGFKMQIDLLRACIKNLDKNAFDHEIDDLKEYLEPDEKNVFRVFFDKYFSKFF